jgi:uncharacterized protein (TIGR00730 family)
MQKQYHIVNPPSEHRMEGELKVCDPEKTDHTQTIESWRIFKIMAEFVAGFEFLRKYKLAATFFGSARPHPGEEGIDDRASKLAAKLARSGFAIISGGAGGVMEAANKGAHSVGGQSLGLNIQLPEEQHVNAYLSDSITFNYFFTRKVMLAFASEVYIFFPGGYGTLDEFLEILTLVQTNKVKRVPIVLFDKEYWTPIVDMFENHLYAKYKTISKDDLSLYVVADTVDEAHAKILELVKC